MRMALLLTASLVAAAAGAQDVTDSSTATASTSVAPAGPSVTSAVAPGVPDEGSDTGQASSAGGNTVKTLSGMSVLGNEEAPKSLVIVPWKSSRLGDGLGIGNALDESPRAVDRDVFMRELHFYELRSGGAE